MGSTERKRGKEQRKEEEEEQCVPYRSCHIPSKIGALRGEERAVLVMKREPERDKREQDDFKLGDRFGL